MDLKATVAVALCIALLVLPGAVGTKKDNTFRYPITEDPGSLNPLFSTSGDASNVMISAIGYDGGIFGPLLDVSYEGFQKREFIPKIITSWEFKNNDSTIIYHLRNDVLWHDGVKLTAHDIKFTYDVITNPESGCVQYVDDFDTWVKDYRVVDDYTFEVDLKISDPYHFQSIYYTTGINLLPYHYFKDMPISRVGFDDNFNNKPIGYGPYVVKDRVVNSYVTLERFDKYYEKGYPKIDRVIYVIIPEVYPRWVAYKNGEIDMVARSNLYLDEFNQYIENKKMTIYSFPSRYFNGFRINFNEKNNPLKDPLVRQAVMYALDRELLCEVVNQNTTVPLKTIVTNRYPDMINPDTKQYPYDPEKAKSLLAQAGYKEGRGGYLYKDGRRLEIHFPYVGGGSQDDVAEWFNAMMRGVGIYANIEQIDAARWRQLADGAPGWDIISISMSQDAFISDSLDFWFMTDGSGNRAGYSNSTLDSLFKAWRDTLDPDEQKEIVYQIQDVIAEDLPFLYVQQAMVVRGYNPGIGPLKSSPWGMESLMMEYYWM